MENWFKAGLNLHFQSRSFKNPPSGCQFLNFKKICEDLNQALSFNEFTFWLKVTEEVRNVNVINVDFFKICTVFFYLELKSWYMELSRISKLSLCKVYIFPEGKITSKCSLKLVLLICTCTFF